jgi:hypothetical protein
MTNPIDKVLPTLTGVRRTGPGRWSAICPAHDDRRPSLSIRETDDCRLLLYCWAGCGVHEIVGALGLRVEDLYPDRERQPGAGRPPVRRPWSASDLLRLAAHESTVVVLVAADLAAGRDADWERLVEAAATLGQLVEVVNAS